MKILRTICLKLRALWQRPVVKREINEELRFHLEQRTAENMAAGMSSEEASREALKRFGNVQSVREECRDTRGASFGEAALQDIRFGLRMLRKNPGFTLVATLTLALGIGSTSSVFSLIQGVLLTPPDYPKPEQLMLIQATNADGQPCLGGSTTEQWTGWKTESQSFEAMAGYDWTFDYLLLPDGGEALYGLDVTGDIFKVIGVMPVLGRTFLESEITGNAPSATFIMLGYDLWKRRYHGDPNIVGQKVRLSRHKPLTVVGVMPPGVRFLPSFGEEMTQ